MNADTLSIAQLAGQRLMVGFDGTELNAELRHLIKELYIGGIILFSKNIETPEQVETLCKSAARFALECGGLPLFVGVDQEGGMVARLKAPFTEFPGNPAMRGPEDAVHFSRTTSQELASVGINMNMAPVMDVPPPDFESVMDGRVFGKDPALVAAMGKVVIDTHQQNGIMAVAKHFPGIGRTTLDSHLEMPFLDTPRSLMMKTDLVPFQAAIQCNVAGIMLSHIRYTDMDPEWPASLSPKIANHLLRGDMGYAGVVMTDDLDMGAVVKHYDIDTAVRQIAAAEVDIALICHKGPNIARAHETFMEILRSSKADLQTGKRSVDRILQLKKLYLNHR